jgi:hypothetical protein
MSDVEEYNLLIDLCFTEEQVQPKENFPLRVNTKEVPTEDKLEEGTAEGSPEGEKGPVEGNPEGTSSEYIPQDSIQVDKETSDSRECDSSKDSRKSKKVLYGYIMKLSLKTYP